MKYNDRFLIKTSNGFVPFGGIVEKENNKTLLVQFTDSIIHCSLNHLLKTKFGFKEASSLSVGDIVFPNERVVSVKLMGKSKLYDIVNVENPENSYFTNKVISHNCQFAGSSATLIDGEFLVKLPFKQPIKTTEDETIRYWEAPQRGHTYVMTVDVSRGRDLDFSAFIVFDVTEIPYKVVCTLKNNEISVMRFPIIIGQIAKAYNTASVLIENNDLGESVCNDLWFNQEYSEVLWTKNGKISAAKDATIGIKTSKPVKTRGCGAIKEIIEKNELVVNDFRIIEELGIYVQNNRGTYEAQDTHINDDLCSCLFLFGYFTLTDYFKDLTNTNVSKKIMQRYEEQMEDSVVPFGFIPTQDDGETEFLSESQIDLLKDTLRPSEYLTDEQIGLLKYR